MNMSTEEEKSKASAIAFLESLKRPQNKSKGGTGLKSIPERAVAEKSAPVKAKKAEKPSQPRETLSALADRSPVLKRYLDFTRNLLSVCEFTESQPGGLMSGVATQRLAEAVRTFYYAECAKSSTHSALPLQGKKGTEGKAKTKANVQPESDVSGGVRTPESQKAAQMFVPLRTRVTRYSNEKGEFVNIDGKLASAMAKEQEVERSQLWEKIPKKMRKVLERSYQDATADEVFLKSQSDTLKDAVELSGPLGLGEDRTKWHERLVSRDPLLTLVNVIDFRQYAALKKAGRLSESAHAKAFLRALTSLVGTVAGEYKLSPDFPTNLAATKQQMQFAVDTLPIWPKTRGWGRVHPKILLLQFILGETDEEALGLLRQLTQMQALTVPTGPLAPPRFPPTKGKAAPGNISDGTYLVEGKKVVVLAASETPKRPAPSPPATAKPLAPPAPTPAITRPRVTSPVRNSRVVSPHR